MVDKVADWNGDAVVARSVSALARKTTTITETHVCSSECASPTNTRQKERRQGPRGSKLQRVFSTSRMSQAAYPKVQSRRGSSGSSGVQRLRSRRERFEQQRFKAAPVQSSSGSKIKTSLGGQGQGGGQGGVMLVEKRKVKGKGGMANRGTFKLAPTHGQTEARHRR